MLLDSISHATITGGIAANIEKPEGLQFDNGQRPADVYVPNWHDNSLCVDVSVVSPFCSTYRRLAAQDDSGTHLAQRAQDKRQKYQALMLRHGLTLLPFIVDVFGKLHTDAHNFLHKLAHMVYSTTGFTTAKALLKHYKTQILFKIVRSVGAQIIAVG
ncbi:hypothetical protein MP638_001793 [Amoeboaphelidium occidentale]|nr:hypothetical protein MP638_001793 [Amoeboaphelidium occidentale]